MTTAAHGSLAAALHGQDLIPLTRDSATRERRGVAVGLVTALLVTGLLAGGDTSTKHVQPVSVPHPVITDRPAPAYILWLERDRFR